MSNTFLNDLNRTLAEQDRMIVKLTAVLNDDPAHAADHNEAIARVQQNRTHTLEMIQKLKP
jgi:hypothetical protein